MAKHIVKYNPSLLSENDLIENFVVRGTDLELIIGITRENITDSNQHVLVIGPRGSGKTTLVLRVAAEIRRDKELNDLWYPLIFSEESYEVVSAGEFWLETLFHLAEQTGDDKWKRTYTELKNETDDDRLGARALGQLLDFADTQRKRILLIVENLNMLFSDLISPDEAWKIRHTLVNEPRLMLLASATSRFENFDNSSQAMFEMFKMHDLVPLDDEECNAIWELIAGRKLEGEKIRPIRILTGGNPRLLTIIAKFGAQRSFGRLLDDLVGLIDDHTEYFKSHLDSLPAIERKVYLALAELWDLSTAREIATAARLDVNKTSSLLSRLVGRGAVAVKMKGKRTKLYVIAERMYNIYYLMRRRGKPADRVKAAVKFMVSMYDPESATKMIIDEACKLAPELCSDHYLAYAELIKEVRDSQLLEKILTSTPRNFLESSNIDGTMRNFLITGKRSETHKNIPVPLEIDIQELLKRLKQVMKLIENGKYEEAIKNSDIIIRKHGDIEEPDYGIPVACFFVGKGLALGKLGRYEDAVKVYEEAIVRYSASQEAGFAEAVAGVLVSKGLALGKLGRYEDAIKVYEEVTERFGDSIESGLMEIAAVAFLGKGVALGRLGRDQQAEEFFREGIRSDPEFSEACIALIKLLLTRPERQADALQAAEEIIGRKPDDAELLNTVSREFYKQGVPSLFQQGETWARRAVSLSPENLYNKHTLACIMSALGKGREALELAREYVADADFVEKTIEDAIELFVQLASSGCANEALELLTNSPAAKHVEPLVVGLKLYIGEDVKTAVEIHEVAKDVVKRIEDRKQRHKK